MLPNFKIGVGTRAWGNQLIWDFGVGYDAQSLRAVFDDSMEDGVRLFCTSELFTDGAAERYLGLFDASSGQKSFIATKFSPLWWRFRRSNFFHSLYGSLKRLRRDSIDLLLILDPQGAMPLSLLAECASEALESGLVRNIGVSNFSMAQVYEFGEVLNRFGVPLTCVEAEYSLLCREPEWNGLLDGCRALNLPFFAQCPLAMGLLTGKYLEQPLANALRRQFFDLYPCAYDAQLIRLMRQIGAEHQGMSAGQVALGWVMHKGAIPIPGAKNGRQVLENNQALNLNLSTEEVERLDAFSARSE